jgi:hypothetical protein
VTTSRQIGSLGAPTVDRLTGPGVGVAKHFAGVLEALGRRPKLRTKGPGVQRSFTSFSAASEEATLSRIFAGQLPSFTSNSFAASGVATAAGSSTSAAAALPWNA